MGINTYCATKSNFLRESITMPESNICDVKKETDFTIIKNECQQLSCREKECMYWLHRGKTAEEISILLGISKRTVEKHVMHIKEKFGCYTLFQLGTKCAVTINK